jgi:hypothetical protein
MATPFRNNTKSEEWWTSCCSGQVKNMFTSAGLIKISVKTMGKEIEGFAHLRQKVSKINKAKLKEGIFVGPQIEQLFKDHKFSTKLNVTVRRAREASENLCRNFLGGVKAENHRKVVQELITSYSAEGCNFIFCIPIWVFS